jgi:hypothetical protein
MIITLDLSNPRKITSRIINDILFELKMRNIKLGGLKRFDNLLALSFLYLLFKNDSALASSTGSPIKSIDTNNLWKALEPHGIPTAQVLYEMLKIAIYSEDYIKLHLAHK